MPWGLVTRLWAAAIGSLSLIAGGASGAQVLDQSFAGPVNLGVGLGVSHSIAVQTVVAGRTGRLKEADLHFNQARYTGQFLLTIRSLEKGVPTGNVLASKSVAA